VEMTDKILDSVIAKYQERSQTGIEKYGKTLEENNLTFTEWLNHLQEELMDATLYIEKLKQIELKQHFLSDLMNFLEKNNIDKIQFENLKGEIK
jgi:hypothetical protein